ncbi:TfpX/TfpZ family type IV pilin accessory protein [Rhizobacter sp. P5_C2]
MKRFSDLPRRLRATVLHLLFSVLVATAASLLVFVLWYPSPYGALTGGLELFGLLTGVDLILGPLLTAVVANGAKPRRELFRDIAAIAVVQLAALGYGLHTIALARPVVIAFEVDRMRVVTASEVAVDELPSAPADLQHLSWTGPKLIAALKPTSADEQFRSMTLGMSGVDLSMVPKYWADYAQARADVLRVAKPVSVLVQHYPAAAESVRALSAKAGVEVKDLRFLPLMSRRASWVTLVAQPDARIVGHLPLDGFF